MYTTGTFRIDRKDVPSDVKLMKEVLNSRKISRGSGYYYRPAIQALTSQSSSDVESSSYYLHSIQDGEEIVEISTDHEPSPIVYTVWRDIRAVCITSCTFPGHSEATVSKMKKLRKGLQKPVILQYH